LLDEALEAFWNMEEDGCPPDEFSCNVIDRGFLRHRDDSRAVLEDSMQFRQLLCSYLVYKKAFQLGYEFYAIVCKKSLKKTWCVFRLLLWWFILQGLIELIINHRHVGILLLKHGLPSTSIIGAFRGTFKYHLVPISISR